MREGGVCLTVKFLLPSLLLIVLLLAGCENYVSSTDEERTASFEHYAATTISGQPAEFFLQSRTAVILSGAYALAARTDGTTLTIFFRPTAEGDYGHAAAIEADGYFITAAHCVGDTINYLVYFDGREARIAVPRVVARQFEPAKSLDFAILHVDARLPAVFAWSRPGELRPGLAAFSVGCATPHDLDPQHRFFEETCLAGEITDLASLVPATGIIVSDLPIRKGDSGSPLVTTRGRLLGINSRAGHDQAQTRIQITVRPDLAWVERVIWEDQLKRGPGPPAMSEPPLPLNPPNEPARSLSFKLCADPAMTPGSSP
jgi:S1-C subfamily serine protease